MINVFAPAKLNLYLHITGRRPDGYHDLDSLVAFAGIGDEIHLEPAETFQFLIEGPQATGLQNESPTDNLVVKAAKSLAELVGQPLNVKITLIKNLPVASGIGGGSSDAAAVLRALAQYWNIPANDPRLFTAAAKHGQDVPVCLVIQNNYMTATGTEPAPALPYADIVMVNPGKGLPTADVYKAYKDGNYDFMPKAQLDEAPLNLEALVFELNSRSNDLADPASYLMPDIKQVLTALEETKGCLLSRMSGSGATCFGFYQDSASARQATAYLTAAHTGWWVVQSHIPYTPSL